MTLRITVGTDTVDGTLLIPSVEARALAQELVDAAERASYWKPPQPPLLSESVVIAAYLKETGQEGKFNEWYWKHVSK